MEVLFVRIPPATKKLMLAEIEAGRYLIRAGLDSLRPYTQSTNVNKTVEDLLRSGGG